MWKLIFIGLIVWFAIHFLKKIMRQSDTSGSSNATNTQENSTQNDSAIEDMVRCATCAVHLPRSEAFLVNGNFYCSLSHIKNK